MFAVEQKLCVLMALGLAGCITSPVWEHGATKDAREARMGECPDGLVDDAEDGNIQIARVKGRDGYWFSSKDPWGTTLEPPGKFAMARSEREGSKYAAHIKGHLANTGDSLYAGMGFSFTDPRTPYDASWAKGLRFWAKGTGRVRLKVEDANTAAEGDRCKDCGNSFGVDLHLQDQWVRYTVPFERMTQQPGWGDRAPKLSAGELFGVVWLFTKPGADYDIWVDDIEFVGCEKPR